jgi:cellulose synthase/poly-beta-1,6-N-acetylglucosamine synthase-like glycosyltransferase
LGNRPEASKYLYYTLAFVFAGIMILMIFVSIWTIVISVRTFQDSNSMGVNGFFGYVSQTPSFRDLVISLLTTYGVYILASLMHLDPCMYPISILSSKTLIFPLLIEFIRPRPDLSHPVSSHASELCQYSYGLRIL